jgi:hypothetical protein
MLTYADECTYTCSHTSRMLTYADVCISHVCSHMLTYAHTRAHIDALTDFTWRMLTCAGIYDVCWRMLCIYFSGQHSKASPRENAHIHTYAMHMLTYADVCYIYIFQVSIQNLVHARMLIYIRMLCICWRMLTYAIYIYIYFRSAFKS